MQQAKSIGAAIILLFLSYIATSQQLRLGNNPYTVEKSAVLELQSNNQGLLFPRIADTFLINALTPPDGMVIYFTTTRQLLLRANGSWRPVLNAVDTAHISNFSGKVRSLFSAGTGISYNAATGIISATNANNWLLTGNAGTNPATNFIGTTDAHPLTFRTNNKESMRLFNGGGMAVGATALDATNPEKLLVNADTTTSFNVISGKGIINNYLQLNIQNRSNGNTASSDLVATADNGSETANFVDLGINSSGFTNTTYPIIGGINNAYLYSTGNDFVIGNATAAKNLLLFTGGYAAANERMRIDGSGNIGIANTAPVAKLDVGGTYRLGAKGTVNKNQANFSASIASTTVPAGTAATVLTLVTTYSSNFVDVTVNIPAANQPTGTQATVAVSPAADLPGTVSIAFARLISTTQLKVRFLNTSTSSTSVSGTFYFSITEF